MAVTPTPALPQAANNKCTILQNSDSTNKITVYTASTNGSRLDTLSAASTDTSAVDLNIWLTDGTTEVQLDRVTIPIGYGTDGTNHAVNILDLLTAAKADNDGVKRFWFKNGCVLKAAAQAAITSGKFVFVYAEGVDL